ncbi:hypothetical protein FOMPIDRAFT_1025674 [Fomitopsis schrenkii]|uniref:Uncharacterized protein n=1 Tax=Fomitopsis schrenkii TaxID=2126942 RepID=S8FAY0_FOMSC|nr:hypothetical protein FOMPIDRAFT_1025674 [Fomitopsis schrenkii]
MQGPAAPPGTAALLVGTGEGAPSTDVLASHPARGVAEEVDCGVADVAHERDVGRMKLRLPLGRAVVCIT